MAKQDKLQDKYNLTGEQFQRLNKMHRELSKFNDVPDDFDNFVSGLRESEERVQKAHKYFKQYKDIPDNYNEFKSGIGLDSKKKEDSGEEKSWKQRFVDFFTSSSKDQQEKTTQETEEPGRQDQQPFEPQTVEQAATSTTSTQVEQQPSPEIPPEQQGEFKEGEFEKITEEISDEVPGEILKKRQKEQIEKHTKVVEILSDAEDEVRNKLNDQQQRLEQLENDLLETGTAATGAGTIQTTSIREDASQEKVDEYKKLKKEVGYSNSLLSATQDLVKEQKELVANVKNPEGFRTLASGVESGVANYFKQYSDILNSIARDPAMDDLQEKVKKYNKGEISEDDFTEEEKLFLTTAEKHREALNQLKDQIPVSHEVGQMMGHSLAFMSEFALTGGVGGSVLKGVKTTGMKGLKKLGVGAGKKMAQAGVQTGVMPSFISKASEQIVTEEGKDAVEDVWNEYTDNFIEIMSERLFMGSVKGIAQGTRMDNVIGRLGNAMAGRRGFTGWMKGAGEEWLEEQIAEVGHGIDKNKSLSEIKDNLFNLKRQAKIAGVVGTMTGVMGAANVTYRLTDNGMAKYRLNKSAKKINPDIKEEIDGMIESSDISQDDVIDNVYNIAEEHTSQRGDNKEAVNEYNDIVKYGLRRVRDYAYESRKEMQEEAEKEAEKAQQKEGQRTEEKVKQEKQERGEGLREAAKGVEKATEGIKQRQEQRQTRQEKIAKVDEKITQEETEEGTPSYQIGDKVFDDRQQFIDEVEKYKGQQNIPEINIQNDNVAANRASVILKKGLETRQVETEQQPEQETQQQAQQETKPILGEETQASQAMSRRLKTNRENTFTRPIQMGEETIGDVTIEKGENTWDVKRIDIEEGQQGKGFGKKIYRDLNQQAQQEGSTLRSDRADKINDNAKGLWDSLVRSGEAIQEGGRYRMLSPEQVAQETEQPTEQVTQETQQASEMEQVSTPETIEKGQRFQHEGETWEFTGERDNVTGDYIAETLGKDKKQIKVAPGAIESLNFVRETTQQQPTKQPAKPKTEGLTKSQKKWVDQGNTIPVAKSLAEIENQGLLEDVQGTSKQTSTFSVKAKNPVTGKTETLQKPTQVHEFVNKIRESKRTTVKKEKAQPQGEVVSKINVENVEGLESQQAKEVSDKYNQLAEELNQLPENENPGKIGKQFTKISKNIPQETKKQFTRELKRKQKKFEETQEQIANSGEEVIQDTETTPVEYVELMDRIETMKKSDNPRQIRDQYEKIKGNLNKQQQKEILDKLKEKQDEFIKNKNKQKKEESKKQIEEAIRGITEIIGTTQNITGDMKPKLHENLKELATGLFDYSMTNVNELLRNMREKIKQTIPDKTKQRQVMKEMNAIEGELNQLFENMRKGTVPQEELETAKESIEDVTEDIREMTIPNDLRNVIETSNKGIPSDNRKERKARIQRAGIEGIIERRAQMQLDMYRINKFVDELKRKHTKEELEVMPFIIEGTEVPKRLERPDLEKAYKELKDQPHIKETVDIIKKHYNNMWEIMTKNLDELSTPQIENYVTHIWKLNPKKRKELMNSGFVTKNRFLNKRYIETLEEGINKYGLKPKVLDISELIKIHGTTTVNITANQDFIDFVERLHDNGMKLILPRSDAPGGTFPGWKTFMHPALSKIAYKGKGKKGEKLLKEEPVKIDPDLYPVVNAVLGHDLLKSTSASRFYNGLTNYMKKAQLHVSFFHHWALIESGTGKMGIQQTGKAMREVMKAIKEGKQPPYRDTELAEMALHDYVIQLGVSSDVNLQMIQRHLDEIADYLEKNTLDKIDNFTGKDLAKNLNLLRGIAKGNRAWDKLLWNFLHDGLKLYAVEHAEQKMPKWVREGSEETKKMWRVEQGQLINDTFGGQNVDMLMMQPETWKWMKYLLLSRDWCVDEKTRAITKTGWKYYNELKIGDEILAIDPKTQKLKWSILDYKYVNNNYKGEMISVKNYNKLIVMTPDHKCLVYNTGKKKHEIVYANQLNTRHNIPRIGTFDLPTKEVYSDFFVKTIGWYVTDGSVKQGQWNNKKTGEKKYYDKWYFTISQSKPKMVEELKELGFEYSIEKKRNHGKFIMNYNPHLFRISKEVGNQILKEGLKDGLTWEFLSKLSKRQLQLLYNTMMKGNGTGQNRFSDGTEKEIFYMTMIQTLLGKPSTFLKQEDNCWRTRIVKSNYISCASHRKGKGRQIDKINYKGTVWCPSVDTGFWIAEREGMLFATGNTLSTLRQFLAPLGIGDLMPGPLGGIYKPLKGGSFSLKERAQEWMDVTKGRRRSGAKFWIRGMIYHTIGMNLLNAFNRAKDKDENPEYYITAKFKGDRLPIRREEDTGEYYIATRPGQENEKRYYLNKRKDGFYYNGDKLEVEDNMKGFWDYTMFNNNPGHETLVFYGRSQDGVEDYMRPGKQFREGPELLFHNGEFQPLLASQKKIGGKIAPVPQYMAMMSTGHSLSAYEVFDKSGMTTEELKAKMAEETLNQFIPFSMSNLTEGNRDWKPIDMFVPRNKGMTHYNAKEEFKKALRKDDVVSQQTAIEEIYDVAYQNGLPAFKILHQASDEALYEKVWELRKTNEDINDVEEKIKEEQNKSAKEKDKMKIYQLKLQKYQFLEKKALHNRSRDMQKGIKYIIEEYNKKKIDEE